MPGGTFDAEDLADAADAVASAGERLDVGLLLGCGSATVDPGWLSAVVGRMSGTVSVELVGGLLVVASRRDRTSVMVDP